MFLYHSQAVQRNGESVRGIRSTHAVQRPEEEQCAPKSVSVNAQATDWLASFSQPVDCAWSATESRIASLTESDTH